MTNPSNIYMIQSLESLQDSSTKYFIGISEGNSDITKNNRLQIIAIPSDSTDYYHVNSDGRWWVFASAGPSYYPDYNLIGNVKNISDIGFNTPWVTISGNIPSSPENGAILFASSESNNAGNNAPQNQVWATILDYEGYIFIASFTPSTNPPLADNKSVLVFDIQGGGSPMTSGLLIDAYHNKKIEFNQQNPLNLKNPSESYRNQLWALVAHENNAYTFPGITGISLVNSDGTILITGNNFYPGIAVTLYLQFWSEDYGDATPPTPAEDSITIISSLLGDFTTQYNIFKNKSIYSITDVLVKAVSSGKVIGITYPSCTDICFGPASQLEARFNYVNGVFTQLGE